MTDKFDQQILGIQTELSSIRRELAQLRSALEDANKPAPVVVDKHPWLRIAATVAVTFVLGEIVSRLRLGAPGAAAVPLIATQFDRKFW